MKINKVTLSILAAFFIALVAGKAIAGEVTVITCPKCRLYANLREGAGAAGVVYTIVYCDSCKKFMLVPTAKLSETAENADVEIVPSIPNGDIARYSFPCPECGRPAVVYTKTDNQSTCPICKLGNLKITSAGQWFSNIYSSIDAGHRNRRSKNAPVPAELIWTPPDSTLLTNITVPE